MVLRDKASGDDMYRQMLGIRSLKISNYSKSTEIDESGLIIVDANFNLYGKINFGNKILLRALNYKIEEIGN
jgi:hypothetical protein